MERKKVAVCIGIVAIVATLIFIQKTTEAFELMGVAAENFLANFPFIKDGIYQDPPACIPTEPYRTCFLIYLSSALISGAISIGSFVYAGALLLKGRKKE